MGNYFRFCPQIKAVICILLAVFTFCCTTLVYGDDITMTCPVTFLDGVQYSLLCRVDKTTISEPAPPGKCDIVNQIRFELLPSGANLGTSNIATCDTAGTGNVRCVNTTSDFATYELRFTANNATHHGHSLACKSDCVQNPPGVVTEQYSSCDPINITDPCASIPCEKSSTCVNNATDPDGFTCNCTAGYKGRTCNTTAIAATPGFCQEHNCLLFLLLLLLLLLPIPLPLPWPGYLIYVLICGCVCNRNRTTGRWHPHYLCGRRTTDVYFSSCLVTNDGRAVLIWPKGRCPCYGTETIPGTNNLGAGHEMDAPPSHSNNVSPESRAVNNGNEHSH